MLFSPKEPKSSAKSVSMQPSESEGCRSEISQWRVLCCRLRSQQTSWWRLLMFKSSLSCFSCSAERCSSVWLWSSRTVLRTTTQEMMSEFIFVRYLNKCSLLLHSSACSKLLFAADDFTAVLSGSVGSGCSRADRRFVPPLCKHLRGSKSSHIVNQEQQEPLMARLMSPQWKHK